MRFVRSIAIETHLKPDAVLGVIQASIVRPRWTERFVPTKPTLTGEVQPDRIILYRSRGGRRLYGEFQGKLRPSEGGTVLEGQFLAYPARGIAFTWWFATIWAVLVVLVSILSWDPEKSPVFLVGAAVAALAGHGFRWFYRKNIEVEAELLSGQLENLLKERGV